MEGEVLQGAIATLRDSRPDLLVEIHGLNRSHRLARAEQVSAFLYELGYRMLPTEPHVPAASRPPARHLFARCKAT
jgi:hypothetical protein